MASFINIEPPRRGPSIGEQIGRGFGEGFGAGAGQASSMYLQGKMQQMFRNQELERARPAALALTKSFGLPSEVADIITENPAILPHLLSSMPQTTSSLFGDKEQANVPMTTPTPPQYTPEQIQAAQIQQNRQNLQPTMQTRGISPEEAALPFVKQEFQRQRQEAPYQAQYAQQAAEAAKPEEERKKSSFPEVPEQKETGIEIPEISPKPSFEKFRKDYYNAKSGQQQEKIKKDYEKQEKAYLDSLQAHNDAVNKQQQQELRENKLFKDARAAIDAKRERVTKFQDSLNLARRAIQMGDTSSWSQFFATKYGINPMKSTANQLLELASKEFTIGSLSNISAKAQNQWIEQRFTNMFPSIGTAKDAQESLVATLQRDNDIARKEVELWDKYSERIKNPNELNKIIYNEMKSFRSKADDKLSYDYSKIKDKYASTSQLYSTDKPIPGEYITPEKLSAFVKKNNGDKAKAVNELLRLGYRLPSMEQYKEWNANE